MVVSDSPLRVLCGQNQSYVEASLVSEVKKLSFFKQITFTTFQALEVFDY